MKHPASPARSGFGLLFAALAAAITLVSCGGNDDGPAPLLEIRTMNNRADLISGGDAMVEVVLPTSAAAAQLKVDVDGRDVSGAFATRSDGKLTGLVTGLATGTNVIS